ncbi:MAG TPA: SDR family oxidoreductase [Actinomycetota bacterium]|nr:SDR family oxidoreductase [Actinomycetota bacterium]
MDLGLTGRKAIVTGGSKGLGRAIADELARAGCAVAICARNPDEVARAAKELDEHGVTVFAEAADVTDPKQVETFMERAAAALGGIDILVNNAGRAHPGTFETLTDEDWKDDLDVKLFSMIRCSREALPHMRARGGGRIININAVQAKSPDPKFFATSTDRAACLAFTKTLSLELAKDNILVNAVNVGFVETPQWENIRAKRAPDLAPEEFFNRMAADEVPLGRFGRPEEVAAAVAFLASERASYITGASLDVAGGMGRYL